MLIINYVCSDSREITKYTRDRNNRENYFDLLTRLLSIGEASLDLSRKFSRRSLRNSKQKVSDSSLIISQESSGNFHSAGATGALQIRTESEISFSRLPQFINIQRVSKRRSQIFQRGGRKTQGMRARFLQFDARTRNNV